MLGVAAGAIEATKFRDDRLQAAASNPALLATEAADYLVHRGVPFRQAHDVVGKILREAERQGMNWTELPVSELQKISPDFGVDFPKALNVAAALESKRVPGGTSQESVSRAIADLEKRLSVAGEVP